MKEKLLIISGGFYPTNSPQVHRVIELVKEFCGQNYDVTLVAPLFDSRQEDFRNKFGFTWVDLGKNRLTPLKRSKNKVYDFFVRAINRILNLFIDFPDVQFYFKTKKVIKNLKGFDLVISVAAPHAIHWAVNSVIRKSPQLANIWIADCGDPFYANQVETYKRPIYFKWIEESWCRRADIIAVPKFEYKFSFLKEFHNKIFEVTQGFNFEEQNKLLKPYIKHLIPTFIYAGSLVPIHRDPSKFLEFIVGLELDFRFHFYTRQKEFVIPFLERAKGRIILHDYLSREDLIGELSKMDFIVNFMYDPYKYAPSKMADFLISERPILNVDYDLDEQNILAFLHGDYSKHFNLFRKDRFDIKVIIQQFIELYNEAIDFKSK